MIINSDFCIVGGGMVGLSIANQLLEKGITKSIVIMIIVITSLSEILFIKLLIYLEKFLSGVVFS